MERTTEIPLILPLTQGSLIVILVGPLETAKDVKAPPDTVIQWLSIVSLLTFQDGYLLLSGTVLCIRDG